MPSWLTNHSPLGLLCALAACASKNKYLEYVYGLCWFGSVEVGGFHPRSMTSVSPGVWLGFWDQACFPFVQTALSSFEELLVISKVCVPVSYFERYCAMRVVLVVHWYYNWVGLLVASHYWKLACLLLAPWK